MHLFLHQLMGTGNGVAFPRSSQKSTLIAPIKALHQNGCQFETCFFFCVFLKGSPNLSPSPPSPGPSSTRYSLLYTDPLNTGRSRTHLSSNTTTGWGTYWRNGGKWRRELYVNRGGWWAWETWEGNVLKWSRSINRTVRGNIYWDMKSYHNEDISIGENNVICV